MSANDIVRTGKPLPRLASVSSVDRDNRLIRVVWSRGPRAGRRETVDLSPLIDTHKFYAPLRGSKLFDSVHIINDGSAIAWGANDEIDMAASSIQRLAEETMTADDYRKFLERNGLTQETAAAQLGRSKRMIAYYLEQGMLPRLVSLACYGLEARLHPVGAVYHHLSWTTTIQTSHGEKPSLGYSWKVAIPAAISVAREKEQHHEN
jgi:hypothetical protein